MTDQMTETAAHFDAVAARWARALRLLAPVTPGLVSGLGPLPPGATLLDVACGTGEPGLSVAAADPAVRLVGIDIAPAMVEQARSEARRRAVAGARFEVGSAERLPLDDASVDALVSRMGLFGFPGSTVRGADEAFRVLRPGGRLAVAVWDRPELNPFAARASRRTGTSPGPTPTTSAGSPSSRTAAGSAGCTRPGSPTSSRRR